MQKRKEIFYAQCTRCIFTLLTAIAAWAYAMTAELTTVGTQHFLPYYYTVPQSVEYIAAGVVLYLLLSALLTAALRHT